MTVRLIPEHAASRIVAIQDRLNTHDLLPSERERLSAEQSDLWDAAFPGQPFEVIRALVSPFLLAA